MCLGPRGTGWDRTAEFSYTDLVDHMNVLKSVSCKGVSLSRIVAETARKHIYEI